MCRTSSLRFVVEGDEDEPSQDAHPPHCSWLGAGLRATRHGAGACRMLVTDRYTANSSSSPFASSVISVVPQRKKHGDPWRLDEQARPTSALTELCCRSHLLLDCAVGHISFWYGRCTSWVVSGLVGEAIVPPDKPCGVRLTAPAPCSAVWVLCTLRQHLN